MLHFSGWKKHSTEPLPLQHPMEVFLEMFKVTIIVYLSVDHTVVCKKSLILDESLRGMSIIKARKRIGQSTLP
ncbi:hypothetical protein DPMN_035432 [Dreissena polymorpha]|uniref:Uncharacterized protein n=1 Tax=Dreissena polymorpha TaxID=45954 RepID=A0A9D4MAY3_DREPO|nr:hypothetical protein DPMN_035432 [Dreissena polymorpha]